MDLGHWDRAIIKSLSWVALGIIFVTLFSGSIPATAKDLSGLIVSLLLFVGVYLLISIIGWLLIGFPTHWLICKFTDASYKFYFSVSIFVGLIIYSLNNQDSLLFALTAFSQAMIFRFYVYKKI
ncbi:hypothetical protein Glaag_2281 [Glaciecola sp. 4H-3-7+YE-5]|nr:hypothetical protein Glaag_2281 [Glaciecola sp. 4H-3-7+YE-5]